MPRPKGSKNKPKVTDVAASLAAAREKKDTLNAQKEELASLIAEKKLSLKAINKDIKALDAQIGKLEAKLAAQEAAEKAAESQKALQDKIQELLDSGLNYNDILELIK